MDLQTKRQLERFFQLMELPSVRVEAKMEFWLPPIRVFIENDKQRLLMSLALTVPHTEAMTSLRWVIGRCKPERTMGIPVRVFYLRQWLVLSCNLPREADELFWLKLYRIQAALLQQLSLKIL